MVQHAKVYLLSILERQGLTLVHAFMSLLFPHISQRARCKPSMPSLLNLIA